MFGSIYVGLSGLAAYSRGLQQVSNNVTNINSSGFKGSTVTFTGLVSRNAGQDGTNGGGNGVANGDTRTDFKQGELRQTERDLDLAVEGGGFLMLMKGDQLFYTRTGSFEVDREGHIVLAGTDYRLATVDASGRAVSLSVDASRTNPPVATSRIRFADNLSSTATSFGVSGVKVFDATGTEHVWQVQFAKSTAAASEWSVTVTNSAGNTVGVAALKFAGGAVDPNTRELVFTDSQANLSVTLDFSGSVTSFSGGSVSTLRAVNTDGHGTGALRSIGVNAAGHLEITYTNEQKHDLGAIALVDFRDPQALEQRAGGLFHDTGTAQRDVMSSEDSRVGRVLSRRLEASNVDLARQFGDLILIQRGFQASSQIISVSNDMIQQLFGIRGQG
jgi:flagellar hook protein FlgE